MYRLDGLNCQRLFFGKFELQFLQKKIGFPVVESDLLVILILVDGDEGFSLLVGVNDEVEFALECSGVFHGCDLIHFPKKIKNIFKNLWVG